MYVFGSKEKALEQEVEGGQTLEQWLTSQRWVRLRDWYCEHL